MVNVEATGQETGFEVLHTVANRVRLRAIDARTRAGLGKIAQKLQQQAGIGTVEVNKETGTLLITFKPDILSLSGIKRMLQPFGITQAAVILPEPSWSKAGKNLKSLLPPLAGLGALRGLQITGWQGLAVYLLATATTREVMSAMGLLEDDSQPKPEAVAKLEAPIQVLHEIPGRVRLRLPRLQKEPKYLETLANLQQWDERITEVRVNPTTAAVVITYDRETSADGDRNPLNASELINLINWVEKEGDRSQESGVRSQESEFVESAERANTEESENNDQKNSEFGAARTTSCAAVRNSELRYKPSDSVVTEEESSDELEVEAGAPTDNLGLTEPEGRESSDEGELIAPGNPWLRFKSCMLNSMLEMMASLPVEPAKA